jgi:cardiolipin synthase
MSFRARTLSWWLAGGVAVAALTSTSLCCSSPPDHEELGEQADAELVARAPHCKDPNVGPALRSAARTDAQRLFVCRVDALENALTQRPIVAGNRVELLRDGPVTHAAQLAAIAHAHHHVHLVTYILNDDEIGLKYRDALTERARHGVKVRVMFDSVGGLAVGPAYRAALEQAGVELHEYAPINPLEEPELWRVSERDHRKLLIVDGRVAFTGGIGISEQYSKPPASGSMEHGWRDTHVRITGPVVAEFQRLFIASWEKEAGPIRDDAGYWPKLSPRGGELVRAVARDGEDASSLVVGRFARLWSRVHRAEQNPIYASYLNAIAQSRSRIWITQAYFAPNPEFLEALERAARRGVDVRLLVPANSDVGLLLHASRHLYGPLLDAGARVFEYEGPVLHAKTAVVDSVWSTVGSSNLDYRSFIHNDEANAIIIGDRFATQMEAMFRDDLRSAREVTRDAYRDRPWRERAIQALAVQLKPLI